MSKMTYRYWQVFLACLSLFVLASSIYLQYVDDLQPCPLCLMQRLCVLVLFVLCLISIWVRWLRVEKVIVFLKSFVAAGGLFFAGRQIWLQSLPAGQTPSCMPGLDVLIHYFPWQDVLRTLLWGTGECAEISWQWLGLSMPAWSALYFLFSLLIALIVFRHLSHD